MKKLISVLLILCLLLTASALGEDTASGMRWSDVAVMLDNRLFYLNPVIECATDGTDLDITIRDDDHVYFDFKIVMAEDGIAVLYPAAGNVGLWLGGASIGVTVTDELQQEENRQKLKAAVSELCGVSFPEEGDYEVSFEMDRETLLCLFEEVRGEALEESVIETALALNTFSAECSVVKSEGIVSIDFHQIMESDDSRLTMDEVSKDIVSGGESDFSIEYADDTSRLTFNQKTESDGTGTVNVAVWDESEGSTFDYLCVSADLTEIEKMPEAIDLSEYTLVDVAVLTGEAEITDEASAALIDMLTQLRVDLMVLEAEESVAPLVDVLSENMIYTDLHVSTIKQEELKAEDVFTDIPEIIGVGQSEAQMEITDGEPEYVYVGLKDHGGYDIANLYITPYENVSGRKSYADGVFSEIDEDAWVIEWDGHNFTATRSDCRIYAFVYMNGFVWTDEVVGRLLDGFVMPEYVKPELKSAERIEEKLTTDNTKSAKPDKKNK